MRVNISRYYNNAKNFPYEGKELNDVFLEKFPGNYTDILQVKQDGVAVFLGVYGDREGACYAYYEKAPFFDRWIERKNGILRENGASSILLKDGVYHPNRVYVSLNLENISEIVATADGKEKRFGTEPGKTFVIVMKDEFDDIVFLTEDGEKISEKDFLK
jgi:hypothetical protein